MHPKGVAGPPPALGDYISKVNIGELWSKEMVRKFYDAAVASNAMKEWNVATGTTGVNVKAVELTVMHCTRISNGYILSIGPEGISMSGANITYAATPQEAGELLTKYLVTAELERT